MIAGLRDFGRRRRTLITVLGSLATVAILAFVLAGRRDEFAAALSVAAWVLIVTVLLQIVALLARSEAWHLSIEAAGGTVDRRVLYRASSMGILGGLLNAHAAVAARIAALRHSSPDVSPQVPTLIALDARAGCAHRLVTGRGARRLVEVALPHAFGEGGRPRPPRGRGCRTSARNRAPS